MESIQAQKALLLDQLERYPLSQPVDLLKFLYQQEFGCGHLIEDSRKSLLRLEEEACEAVPHPVEPIGNGLCRLHLCLLKQGDLTSQTLHRMFELSALRLRGTREGLIQRANQLQTLCQAGDFPDHSQEVQALLEQWQQDGEPLFRHSAVFRDAYHPAYRVVEASFGFFLPLFQRIDTLLRQKKRVLLALDGRCASGKTTLSKLLELVYQAAVVPMDHFFPQPHQRTASRLEEPGGNVDYERFHQEVLLPLLEGRSFSYRPYDCHLQQLGDPLLVPERPLTVVEGSYSLHPTLSQAHDCKVFLTVSPQEQLQRIRMRNGPTMAQRFQQEWIPLEERYFQAFSVPQQCEFVFDTGEHPNPLENIPL